MRNSIVLLSAGALLAILLAWFIIRIAMRKLGADPAMAAQVARRIASGDLQFEMEARPARRHQPHGRAAPDEGQPAAFQARLPGPDQRDRQGAGRHRVHASRATSANANEIFLNVLGYALEDVKGKNYSMFVDSQDSAATQGLWQALQRGESRQGEFRVMTRDKQRGLVPGRVQSDRRRLRQAVQGRRLSERRHQAAPGSAVERGVPRRAGSPRCQRDGAPTTT